MEKLLTISVAAYNVEAYLEPLMRSIIDANVMDALEVLIVNDGSTDGTAALAGDYARRWPASVRLIDKPNGGHGSTINRGIREATGKYFRALDGDDWVHPAHLAALVRRLPEIEAELILSDYRCCYEDGREVVETFSDLTDGETYSMEEIVSHADRMLYHAVIFRTDLLKTHDIRLDEHCFYVDTEFMLYPVPYIHTVYYAQPDIYCYRLGLEGQSVSISSRVKHIENGRTVADSLLDFYSAAAPLNGAKRDYLVRRIAGHCLWHIKSLMYCPESPDNHRAVAEFDREIRARAPEIWREMANKGVKSRLLRTLRLTGYRAYGLIARRKEKESR